MFFRVINNGVLLRVDKENFRLELFGVMDNVGIVGRILIVRLVGVYIDTNEIV